MDPSDLELVRGVRTTPGLFNPMNPDFKFAHRKEKIWKDLALYLGISPHDARRRWTCLRDRYSRELKSRRLAPKSEYGPDEFFKEMDFLRPFVRKRKERRSIVCQIKSDAKWDGKVEQNYDTSDSYSNKMESGVSAVDDVNVVDDGYHDDFKGSKCDTVTIVMGSRNEEEGLISADGFEEYHVNCDLEESTENVSSHTCDLLTETEHQKVTEITRGSTSYSIGDEDDFFCKSICAYLRQLSRVHKIKAKVEMFQILEKYIEIEES